jgi:gluconate kinase
MGVSGCGKSTLGALLAGALDCPFLEGDDFHDARAVAKMRAGQPWSTTTAGRGWTGWARPSARP